MQNETSQYDIATHQLLTPKESRRLERHTEIGEVRVVHTIFGKAKVRAVRKYHNPDLLWSAAIIVVAAFAVAAFLWKGTPPSPEPAQQPEAVVAPPVMAQPEVSPAPQPASAMNAETLQPAQNASKTAAEHQAMAPAMDTATVQAGAQSAADEPPKKVHARKKLEASKQESPVATSDEQKPPASAAQAAMLPSAARHSEQPAAAKPVQAAPQDPLAQPAEPLVKGNAKVAPPPGDDHPAAQATTQP